MHSGLKQFLRPAYPALLPMYTWLHYLVLTPFNMRKNRNKAVRMLEIGPGAKRIDGFESLNVVAGLEVDYVMDASRPLPFEAGTFDLIYASHVLEHVPWYRAVDVLKDWCRTLKAGGTIEIFVPDGLKIARTFVDAEAGRPDLIGQDGWYRFNAERDPCLWMNGRVFSYGDGTGRKNDPNWHFGLFSERYLKLVLQDCGLHEVVRIGGDQVRGYDHGWINLGMRGTKR